jgi:uncharacterized protein (TIGR03083 family)
MSAEGAVLTRAQGAPWRRALDRTTALSLAATEYGRFADALRALSPEDWTRRTSCPAWDVHAVACHVLGMAEFSASPIEQARQMRAAKRRGGLFIDALTGLQVDKHVSRSPDDVLERLDAVGPRATKGRRRTPAPLRAMRMKQAADEKGEQEETWTLGFLVDIILTRDTWMHRSDVAEATGRPMTLTPDHDGVIVADVAAEWASRHGQPCALTLTGPAGGSWTWGSGGPALELDAVEFCRVLSGRGVGEGLLATRVPF